MCSLVRSLPSGLPCPVSPRLEGSDRRSRCARDAVRLSRLAVCLHQRRFLRFLRDTFADTFFLFARHVRYILLSAGTFTLRAFPRTAALSEASTRDTFLLIRCSSRIFLRSSPLIFCIAFIRSVVVYTLPAEMQTLVIMKSSYR
jgi:hypothetical protein